MGNQKISVIRRSMLAMLLALATPVAAQSTDNKGGEAGVTRIQLITGDNVLTATLDKALSEEPGLRRAGAPRSLGG